MQQICVIGLGNFGSYLARKLEENDVEVLAIDNDANKVGAIRDLVHQSVIADASDFESLKRAIPEDVDHVIVSLGDNLEASIICALHLKNLEVRNISAKASSDEHAQILRALGVNEILFPERDTAERLALRITRPNLVDLFPISEEYEIQEIAAPESLTGKSLANADVRKKYGVMVVAVRKPRTDQTIFMPEGTYEFQRGDLLVALGEIEKLEEFQKAE